MDVRGGGKAPDEVLGQRHHFDQVLYVWSSTVGISTQDATDLGGIKLVKGVGRADRWGKRFTEE